jgi:N-acetylmuramoyl-L-alanine amidase
MVVIHYTAMDSAAAACRTLCNTETEVSAHYLIAEDGTVMSLVAEEMRAWHAGAGAWGRVTDVNSRSIGIELANTGATPFSAPQIHALETLLHGIRQRWAVRPERIIGHSDMAPGRKIDPGRRFDWRRLALQGFSIWPEAALPAFETATEATFAAQAETFGYVHQDAAQLLYAFRTRFRPWADGPLDATDLALITNLATRFPVDALPATA